MFIVYFYRIHGIVPTRFLFLLFHLLLSILFLIQNVCVYSFIYIIYNSFLVVYCVNFLLLWWKLMCILFIIAKYTQQLCQQFKQQYLRSNRVQFLKWFFNYCLNNYLVCSACFYSEYISILFSFILFDIISHPDAIKREIKIKF